MAQENKKDDQKRVLYDTVKNGKLETARGLIIPQTPNTDGSILDILLSLKDSRGVDMDLLYPIVDVSTNGKTRAMSIIHMIDHMNNMIINDDLAGLQKFRKSYPKIIEILSSEQSLYEKINKDFDWNDFLYEITYVFLLPIKMRDVTYLCPECNKDDMRDNSELINKKCQLNAHQSILPSICLFLLDIIKFGDKHLVDRTLYLETG
jgi:hypothetical protein